MAAMEGLDRAHSHRSGGRSRSEFFICFTSRPSSSSSAVSGSAAIRVPSSKSLMSPGRGRDPGAPSLSASLSRRLRSSGSVKGGQSPMFPAGTGTATAAGGGGGRRKGCGFEAVEPSSPKVTCIGQVRVKTKKKKGKGVAVTRSRSGREASFRRTSEMGEGERECMPQRNQSWVYQLPLSICEALRAFGSEFNCLVPCRGGGRSPCSSSREGQGKGNGVKRPRGTSSCGAVFARWLMAIEEGEEGERGGEVVGLVVEGREKGEVGFLVREREKEVGVLEIEEFTSVMEAEKKEEMVVVEEEEEEEGRVSVCIPPRNALLLMRCRSDPVRVAALADRFWGSPAAANAPCEDGKGDEDDGNAQEQVEEEVAEALDSQTQGEVVVCSETAEGMEKEENAANAHGNLEGRSSTVEIEEKNVLEEKVNEEEEEEEVLQRPLYEKETGTSKEGLSAETFEVQRKPSTDQTEASEGTHLLEGDRELKDDTHVLKRETKEGKGRRSISCSSSKTKEAGRRRNYSYKEKERKRHSFSSEREARRNSFSSDRDARRASFSVDREGKKRWSFALDKEELAPKDKVTTLSAAAREETNIKQEFNTGAETRVTTEVNKSSSTGETQAMASAENEEEEREKGGRAEEKIELPDCLMLMMYEPKLSMEVSKETWVCSTDFIHHPQYHHRPQQISKTDGSMGGDNDCSKTKEEMTPAAEPTVQPPAPPLATAPPTASDIEQKVMGSGGAPVSPAAPPAYGPFVLTRCKSEPMRSSASLAPDACFWKSRHRPIGAAGIGF